MTVYYLDYGQWPVDRGTVGVFTKAGLDRYLAEHPVAPEGEYDWYAAVLDDPTAEAEEYVTPKDPVEEEA